MRLAFFAIGLVACGGATPPTVTPSAEGAVMDQAAGVDLLLFERPGNGTVWLSLFIDAGARDTDPPQVATVAAWSAAGELSARTLADAVEFEIACPRGEIERCLGLLASAAGRREVSEEAIAAAIERLRATRGRAGADPRRQSDGLALRALLGEGTDPLGTADDDARVDVAAVSGFLASHFGPSRALLVAVGDVDADALRAGVAEAFADAPSAASMREGRAEPTEGVRVEVGEADWVSVATLLDSPEAAVVAGRRFVARMDGGEPSADVFPIRGGYALIVRAAGVPAELVVHRARELLVESTPGGMVPPEEPLALARWHGALWATRGEAARGGLGVGVLLEGGRGDLLSAEDPDEARRQSAREELEGMLAREPSFEGELTRDGGQITLANGARIAAQRRAGPTAVIVSFEGGAGEETPREHGHTAHLASVAVRQCARAAVEQLGWDPVTMGLEIWSFVEAERWGLGFSGAAERWAEITYLAGQCALPVIEPAVVESERPPSDPELAALAAAISPEHPGRVSPRPGRLGTATTASLERWGEHVVGGARAHIGLVSDEPERAARRLLRNVARWPRGRELEGAPWSPSEAEGASAESRALGAWIFWSAPAPNTPATRRAVERFLERVMPSLTGAGIRPTRHVSGVAGGQVWGAWRVQTTEAGLATLPARARAASSSPPPTPSVCAVGGRARDEAHALARPPTTEISEEEIVRAIEGTPPRFVVLRPSSD